MTEDNKRIQKLSANMDFYSDRAGAHASIFVAFVFGLFAILSLKNNIPNDIATEGIFTTVYFLVFLAGCYSLANFCLYATYANNLQHKIGIEVSEMDSLFLKRFRGIKSGKDVLGVDAVVMECIYSIIAGLSYLLVIESNVLKASAIISVFCVTAFLVTKMACALYDHFQKNRA